MAKRIVIIGNCGSGKSYLARALASGLELPIVHLDSIFWLPRGFNAKRSPEEVEQLLVDFRSNQSWIVEGVFGELAARFLDLSELLIWLDMPWEVCRSNLQERGSESSKQNDPIQAEESFRALLVWSSEYWSRTNLRSYSGHLSLFTAYDRKKRRFSRRSEVDAFLAKK